MFQRRENTPEGEGEPPPPVSQELHPEFQDEGLRGKGACKKKTHELSHVLFRFVTCFSLGAGMTP